MEEERSLTTGIDGLIRIVHDRKRIELHEAAASVGVPTEVVEEWARSLEEEGLLKLEYQFTKVFLVWKELTPEQVDEKLQKLKEQKAYVSRDLAALIQRTLVSGSEVERTRAQMEKLVGTMDQNLPAALRKRLDMLRTIDVDKEKIVQQRMKELDYVRTTLDSMGTGIAQKKKDLEELKQKSREIEGSKALRGRIEEIVEGKKKLDETLHSIGEMTVSLEESVKRSTANKRDLDSAIAAMRELEAKMGEMIAEKKQAQDLVEQLEERVGGIDKKLATMRDMMMGGDITDTLRKLESEKRKIELLEKEISAQNEVLSERTDAISKALGEHQTQYENILEKQEEVRTSLKEYENDLNDADVKYRKQEEYIRRVNAEMTAELNRNKREIENQLELAREGLEKYEKLLAKREDVLKMKTMLDEMEVERNRLVKQLRLISKSLEMINVGAGAKDTAGAVEQLQKVQTGIVEAKKSEESFESKRAALREKMKDMIADEGKKK